MVRPDADRRDFSDRRHSRREDSRDRGRSRRRRERSVSNSPWDSELERESRRERRRHGRSRRRGDRTPTPPQPSSLATDQILKAIAELKSATDAVTSRVHGLERREGATHSAHSPLPPLLEEEDISLCPPRDDLMSSEEEGSRDWRPQHGDHDSLPEVLPCGRESSVATSRPSAQESVGRDEALPSGDPDARRYKDTLQSIFSFNPNMVPQNVPVDNVFGGELMALCHETQKEDRHPSLSGSGVLGSALRHTAGVLGGVAHSPLVEAGRARESAQRWGTYMSLTSPPIRQYRPEYYRVHYSADVPEAEVLQPQQLYSTSSFLAIAKGTPPTDFRIRHSLLRDWEGLQRASLGVINHLDWFLSTVWKMVGTVEVEPQMRANIDNMLTSSSVAVNHLAHMQARLLAGNATFRREGLLDTSVLDRAGAQFLRSQPIGGADLFAGKVPEALRVASEDRNKQLLFQAAVKPAGRGAGGSPRGPPRAQRGGFRKRKGFTPSTSQVTHKRPKPRCLDTWRRERGPSWASRQLGPTNRRFDGPQLLNSTPVGARLRYFPREWDNLTTDRYVRSIVRDGYRVELISAPPLSPVPIPMKLFRDTEQSNALLREIMSLLDKGAIEELDPRSLSPGFYSRLFLVPKTDGSHRPVFDLKSLNQFVHKEKFKMTTPRTVTNAMHKGDWAVSIDLKDAYFHVPIHVRSRRLLRFAIATNDGLRVFEFRALPFGLTSAPRVFTKVILPLGHHAHLHAVCLLQYLDDWLLRSPNKSLLARQTSWLLDIIRRVGFVLNVAKSQLTPTQRLIHIGWNIIYT